MVATAIGSLLRGIFFMIDSLIYSLVPSMYSLLNDVSNINGFIKHEQTIIDPIATNIYTLLAVIMLFRVAFSLLTMIADPDKIEDKEKGLSKIITSVIGCIVLIIAVPLIFNIAGEIQEKVLTDKLIESIVLSDHYCEQDEFSVDQDTKCKPKNTGLYLSYSMLSLVLNIDEGNETSAENDSLKVKYESIIKTPSSETAENFKEQYKALSSLGEDINESVKSGTGVKKYYFNYTIIISTLLGVYLLWIVTTFVIDVAYRSLKLFFLKLIAPVAIISFVDPSSASKGIFKKWSEECIKTYLSIFLRIASLAVVSLIVYSVNFEENKVIVKIFFFLAVLTLLKTLPKLLETLFGVKPKSKEESFGQSLLRGALGAATVGTYGGLAGGISAKRNKGSFLGGMFTGGASGLLGGATSAYNGKFGDFTKAFGNSTAAVAKAYGYKTGAEIRKEKMKYNADKKYSQGIFDNYKQAYANDKNNQSAQKFIDDYKQAPYGVEFTKNQQGQIRKAHAEKNAYSSILSQKAAANRGNLAIKKTEARLLGDEFNNTVRAITATSDDTEKARLNSKAAAIQTRLGKVNKEVGDLESEWKEVIAKDPGNYRDIQTYQALEMAKADRSNKLKNDDIDELLSKEDPVQFIKSGKTTDTTRSSSSSSSSPEPNTDSDDFKYESTIFDLSPNNVDDEGFEYENTLYDVLDKATKEEKRVENQQEDYINYMRDRDPDNADIDEINKEQNIKKQEKSSKEYTEYMKGREPDDI